MSNGAMKRAEQTLAFVRYLSWADLLRQIYEAEATAEVPAGNISASRNHEWRLFGLMCYWHSSLHVVIEAWDEIGFTDRVIDQLLSHPKNFRTLLRRYRNAIFHFQPSVIDPRIIGLLEQGTTGVFWVQGLHDELLRFAAEHLSAAMATDEQRAEFREDIEAIIKWYPSREAPQIDALEQTLMRGRKTLSDHPDDQSAERNEVEENLRAGEAALQQGRRALARLRAQLLRKAGVEPDDEIQ